MEIYRLLPIELQYTIKKYFYIYERWGITKMKYIQIDPKNNYYNKIRKCPRGMKWNPLYPFIFYYRRQKHYFQWDLRIREDEIHCFFHLTLYPQWDYIQYNDDVYQLFDYSFYNDINPPIPIFSTIIYETSMDIKYRIQKPFVQSKQAYVNNFCEYIKLLSEHADIIIKNIHRKNIKKQ
jgi:hypothetical protein